MTRPYRGVFPVVPTTFTASGELDLESQKRCVDFMIDAGSHGLCILANFSEQFVLSDDDREVPTKTILEHAAGRLQRRLRLAEGQVLQSNEQQLVGGRTATHVDGVEEARRLFR